MSDYEARTVHRQWVLDNPVVIDRSTARLLARRIDQMLEATPRRSRRA